MTDDDLRLPRSVRPLRYRIDLDVDLSGAAFRGEVEVALEVLEATSRIECHALHLDVIEVSLDDDVVRDHRLDPDRQRLVIDLDAPLEPGRAQLRVRFAGELNDRLVGFYRSTYDDEDGTHTLAITQFEAPHARQCFPCWDEPDRKATFEAHLTVDDGLLAVANSAEVGRTPLGDGRVRVSFAETMPMSTYLVAFVVGRLEASRTLDVDGTPVRVIHRPGQGHLVDEALAVAEHSLRWFADYYGIPYPGDKLDLVAVPDFAFGAMENLGCVTFREVLLLLDPATLTQPELERATLVIAHELAHMWFGDLVTMDWWDGIWLNEAFATFMELACVDAYRPEWGVWNTFGLSRREAFETDALGSTRSIHYEVRTPEDAEGMFDILTYEKGAAVLRMLEQHLGREAFREGIRRYLAAHSYANTSMSDLWAALDATSGLAVAEVMDSWILQGGHPLVTATPTATGLRLTQERMGFAGGAPADPATYAVPIRLRATVDGARVERRTLLDTADATVDLGGAPEAVCLNVEAVGFYRSAADGIRLAADSPAERFDLVDGAWARVLADRCTLADVIGTLRDLRANDDPSTWRRAAAILHAVVLVGGAEHELATAAVVAQLVEPVLASVDEPEHRGVLLRIAGTDGASPAAIDEARSLVAAEGSTHPELLAAAVDVTAAHADVATFERYVERYRNAETPQEVLRYLGALTRVRDADLFARLLELCATEVRTQNAPYTLAQAMGNALHGPRAWEFVRDHWDDFTERFPSNSIVRMASGIRALFDPAAAADARAFFEHHPVPQGATTMAQHLEIVRVHQALRARELPRLAELSG